MENYCVSCLSAVIMSPWLAAVVTPRNLVGVLPASGQSPSTDAHSYVRIF